MIQCVFLDDSSIIPAASLREVLLLHTNAAEFFPCLSGFFIFFLTHANAAKKSLPHPGLSRIDKSDFCTTGLTPFRLYFFLCRSALQQMNLSTSHRRMRRFQSGMQFSLARVRQTVCPSFQMRSLRNKASTSTCTPLQRTA